MHAGLPMFPPADSVSADSTAVAPAEDSTETVAAAPAPVDSAASPEPVVETQDNGHFGSLKFKTEDPAPDSGAVNMRHAHLDRDSAIILDPERDSAMIAQRVEEAKRQVLTIIDTFGDPQ